jgi:hypothetical protein
MATEMKLTYVETGEVPPPRAGEWFRTPRGGEEDFSVTSFPILAEKFEPADQKGAPHGRECDQQVKQEPDFYEALSWINGAEKDGYPSEHAALVEYCFAPPESYDDTWLAKIWDLYLYVLGQPCVCTEPAVDLWDPCPRCRLLNRKFDEYDGRGR